MGIRLVDGSEHRGDYSISAADGYTTIFEMLDGKYVKEKILGYYNSLPVYPPLVYVNLGVARSFDKLSSSVTGTDFPLDEPINIGGQMQHRMGFQAYNFDSTIAPTGKTVVKVMFASDYEFWNNLRENHEGYQNEKKQIADQVIKSLEKRFPGLANQVEMIDVATPLTWERYTGNWKGSFQGWLESSKTLMMRMEKSLPGLGNFYMAGQWVEPGGSIPTAVMSGRNVMQIICRKDKKSFSTQKPENDTK